MDRLADADPVNARIIAGRVIKGLQALTVVLPDGARVGASFGIATHADAPDPAALVAAADAAMYRAKRDGGDRIAHAGSKAGAPA